MLEAALEVVLWIVGTITVAWVATFFFLKWKFRNLKKD